jgi:tetratricopeptide (TPR) repeat protein
MIVSGPPGSSGVWPMLAVAVVLILAALGAYWNSFNVPLLFDDSLAISDNPSIRHLEQMGPVLSPPTTTSTAARPILNLSLALNYAAGGTSVQGYHAVNLFIHICAGLVLLGIVRRTLLSPGLRHRYGEAALPLAACAALLWTLHPLLTESVTYISQRAESLMGLFYLLTLYGFIRSVTAESRNCWLMLSVAACLCGMATKQVMVTAPVLVLLYDRAFVSGSFRSAWANRRWYYVSLAASWLLLGFLMYQSPLPKAVGFQAGVNWPTYALTELRVVTDYLKLAFWPHPLVFDYGSEILVTDPLAAAPYALIVAAVVAGVVLAWRRSPTAGFLGCWFFLILAPTSTVIPIAEQPMAESRMYLPLAAVVVLVTLLSYALGRRRALVVLGFVAVGLGALTVGRNHDYQSELSIWEDTVARHPYTSRGHYNLAIALAKVPGRLPDAIAHYEETLRINPNHGEAQNNLAVALAEIPGRLPDAIAHYDAALHLNPTNARAHNNLGLALAQMPGRLPEAIGHYEEALRLKPDLAEAHNNLGMALARTPGRLPDAMAHYEEALRLQPKYAEAHTNLAAALAEMPGRLAEAIAHYEAALRLKPDLAEAHNNLAVYYAENGQLEAAIGQLEIAARLNPTSAAIRNNLEKMRALRKP